MDDAMTNPARTPRFLDQVEDSASLAMGAKVQVWGGPETGQEPRRYENLPRPLIVVDSDRVGGLFNDDRFDGFKRLGPDKIPDLETLVAFLDEFTSEPRWYRGYKSLLIDSLTQFVDPKVAELGIDNSSAAPRRTSTSCRARRAAARSPEQGRAQADWARIAKELTRLIRKVSALGRARVRRGRGADEVRRQPAGRRRGRREVVALAEEVHARVRPHRAEDLALGGRRAEDALSRLVEGSEAERGGRQSRDLAPCSAAPCRRARGLDDFDPATTAHEELMDLLKTLAPTRGGGKIPLAKCG
jgi:hypothetical protein